MCPYFHYNSNDEVLKILYENQLKPVGDNNAVWDGKDSNNIVVPAGYYKYTISATASNGSSDVYAPLFTPQFAWLNNLSGDLNFNPNKGEVSPITYSITQPTNVRIWIAAPLYRGTNVKTIMNKPQIPGSYTVYWDGKNESGNIVNGEFGIMNGSSTLPYNSIIVDTDFNLLSNVSAEARTITPAYDQVSSIYYTLSNSAQVTIKIYDPNGNYFATLLNAQDIPSGSHIQQWDGTADNGGIISTEGYYKVEITAEKPEYSYTETVYTSIKAFK